MRKSTAAFIVLAVLTTCGRNIFPCANRSPTAVIPLIRGPSMIACADGSTFRASVRSSFRKVSSPLRSASASLCSKESFVLSSTGAGPAGIFLSMNPDAASSRREVASSLLQRITSSIIFRSSSGISPYSSEDDGLTIAISSPAGTA